MCVPRVPVSRHSAAPVVRSAVVLTRAIECRERVETASFLVFLIGVLAVGSRVLAPLLARLASSRPTNQVCDYEGEQLRLTWV
eukprot:scaffold78441_cov63-Phaeocystis_antarctica.AAC.4